MTSRSGTDFDRADLLEMIVRALDISGSGCKSRCLGLSSANKQVEIVFGDPLDGRRTLTVKGGAGIAWHPQVMEQREIVLVGRVEMRRALWRAQLGWAPRDHREARLEQGETVDIEGPGDELGGIVAGLLDVIVRVAIFRRDDAANPGVIVAVNGGKWGERCC